MDKEEIKMLAKLCLMEKWYGLDINDEHDWVSDCAFCEDAKNRRKGDEHQCSICYIKDLPICDYISASDNEAKDLIIKALEELTENGELSPETEKRLYRA